MLSLLTITRAGIDATGALRSATVVQDHVGAELLVAHPDPLRPIVAAAAGPEAIVMGLDDDFVKAAAKEAQQAYDQVCGARPRCRYKETGASAFETLRKQALFVDLCILDRDPGLIGNDLALLKTALVSNRVPTILLPPVPIEEPPTIVVCAWNGQAPAARAIRAAIPFAQKARRFVVLEHAGNEINRSRLERFLHSHGVTAAEWRPYGDASLTARGRARALLAETQTLGAHLLVMGAYGDLAESVFRFGRATDKVATAAKIPVLFSH
jgi:nucleotide-binding universal stress UspA family protein